jgi:hypothetical protein
MQTTGSTQHEFSRPRSRRPVTKALTAAPGLRGPHKKKAGKAGQKVDLDMNNILAIGTAAQLPPFTAALDDAIRDARAALLNGSLDGAIDRLKDASRVAREVEVSRA